MSKQPSCFVATIDLNLAERLKQDLIAQGFTLSKPQYTLFSAQKKGVSCTLYESGKLTVQGKEMGEFITFYLEPTILQTFSFSHPEAHLNLNARIGIDESGKGDFFGPLCVAGVQAGEAEIKELVKIGVKDSKSLSDTQSLALSMKIKQVCPVSSIVLFPKKYNELYTKFKNLNRLLGWGHATAIQELVVKTGCLDVIIDQFADESVVQNAIRMKNLELSLTQRHRAEEDPVVAAASIVARATFLNGMKRLGEQYGIELPKGASKEVLRVGKLLVSKWGKEVLEEVAKLHFKTTQEIVQ